VAAVGRLRWRVGLSCGLDGEVGALGGVVELFWAVEGLWTMAVAFVGFLRWRGGERGGGEMDVVRLCFVELEVWGEGLEPLVSLIGLRTVVIALDGFFLCRGGERGGGETEASRLRF
jgi:hypothetical protein